MPGPLIGLHPPLHRPPKTHRPTPTTKTNWAAARADDTLAVPELHQLARRRPVWMTTHTNANSC